jgi:DNA-binding protein
MPFSFLNPWFWLAALAVAAPLWLHLRRRRETNILRFSTVRFLDEHPTPRRSPLRLRNLILLAVRVLAVLFIVAGFAWPFLRGRNTVAVSESRVYVLDNTLSHQANDGFERDRRRLLNELNHSDSDVQSAVIELTSTPRVVVAFGEERQAAVEKIEALRPSFQRGSFLAAFRQASEVLASSLGERKRVILLSDNQQNQWTENVNTPPFLRNVQVELPKPATTALPNLSLFEPRAQRIFLGDKSLVNFTVKLQHTGAARTANVVLQANGQAVLNRAVDLNGQPETILVQAQWEAEPSAWLTGQATVTGTPDALPADNDAFFSLAPVREGKVALLAQSPYLRLALSPEIMRGQWATRVLEPTNLGRELSDGQDADVLCLESSYLASPEARKLLMQYLSRGRGVFLIVNRLTPAAEGCLRELGFEAESLTTGPERPEKFQFFFSNHPIFHPFLSPDYGNLMEITVSHYVNLRPTQGMPLIFSESGAGLFFQGTKYPGKLFVAAFGMERSQSSWPLDSTFIPFLDLTLQAARAEDPTPNAFEPGETGVVQLPGGAEVHEVVLRERGREISRAPVELGRAQVRLPDQPGVYALTYDAGEQVEKMFSVNPSSKESQLAYVETPEALNFWRLTDATPAERTTSPQEEVHLAGVLHQRFWWWMVLGALAALLLEATMAEVKKEEA